ncbi:hypothetical protein K3495_g7978 [Podosphaera aphanis]|nr:hypothetical protein K3495_g7978 [Podosphaera aphanis]
MEEPSSSKVTVEYFDPYGVYPLLSPGLLQRLPLRNLHWESHAGPLRSISSLHIELIPSTQESFSQAEPQNSSSVDTLKAKSSESLAAADDTIRIQPHGKVSEQPESHLGLRKVSAKERRHQIPGLRQTPYLKIYLLRCDDNESYKAHARRQVRQWIKEHASSSQTSSKLSVQDNHDSYEWMIIHVVIPNTAAAAQPRLSGKHTDGSSGLMTEISGPRWPGVNSNTLLEKMKADFNGSSRSSVDRVAQIRIGINDVPYELLPRVVPVVPKSYSETLQENENAWLDLISKFKSLILASFDTRVSQYEEDIREKDAQRSLPGWNFCTFFVLKEGLARGFESVGLVEDSLVEYDELAVRLDTIVREQAISGSGPEHGGLFLPFTEDLRIQAEAARASLVNQVSSSDIGETDSSLNLKLDADTFDNEASEIPLNATKKRYRELILANDISVFEFRCYLFARQLHLLLRLANVSSSKEELLSKLKGQGQQNPNQQSSKAPTYQPREESENLAVLGNICRRAMEFISSIAHVMRADIWASYYQQAKGVFNGKINKSIAHDIMVQVTDNIVSSFTFAVAQQILAQTATKSLPIPPSISTPHNTLVRPDKQDLISSVPSPKLAVHPTRSSSLADRSNPRKLKRNHTYPSGRRASVPERGGTTTPSFLKMGLEEFAAQRAHLYLLSRSVLQRIGAQCEWSVGWSELADLKSKCVGKLEDIDINQNLPEDSEASRQLNITPSNHGNNSKLLRAALNSADDFYGLYETLSDKALRHYIIANRSYSVQSCMADIAVLKYYLKDYAAAAFYLDRIMPFYEETGWTDIELPMLIMYAKCLQQLERREEYVHIVLKLLAKVAVAEKERLQHKSPRHLKISDMFHEAIQLNERYLPELCRITKARTSPITIPLQNLFGQVEVNENVKYYNQRDSFGLQLLLLYLLDDELEIETVKVKISPIAGDVTRDIWLESNKPLVFHKGIVTVSVQSNTTIPGRYCVTSVILSGNNVIHLYDQASSTTSSACISTAFLKCPKLLLYQRPETMDIKLDSSKSMQLRRERFLELEVSSGWNQVTSAEIRIRSATAGLRLQTSEPKLISGTTDLRKNQDPGLVCIGALERDVRVRIAIPFNLEQEVGEISVKLEMTYITEHGTFLFALTSSVPVMFLLGVNVMDVFKHKSLFSNFTISSVTTTPLRLLGSSLVESEIFEAHGGLRLDTPLVIFPRQPATILYKITKSKRLPPASELRRKSKDLSLVLHFSSLEEEIEATIASNLGSALKNSPFASYTRLVTANLLREVRHRLSSQELERVALLSEVSTSFLASVKWREQFIGLGRSSEVETAKLLSEFIQAWLKQQTVLRLMTTSQNDELCDVRRSIVVPFDVPSIMVVLTADIRLLDPGSPYSAMAVATTNQPISVSFEISWSRIWDRDISAGKNNSSQTDFEFFYEIADKPDTWIIGGRRKGHFTVPKVSPSETSAEPARFPLLLIPIREGFLPYPAVEIRAAPMPRAKGSESEANPNSSLEPTVTFEVDYKNASDVIRVINGAQKITVSLDNSFSQGHAVLLETDVTPAERAGVMIG